MKNMAKITYENKVALNENSQIAEINKVTADNMNEIKSVINTNDDNTTANTNNIANNAANIGTLSDLNTTNKSNLVSSINELNNRFNFAETEQIIGTWINNKPVYQKIVSFEVDNNSNKSVAYNIENIEEIWIDEKSSFISNNNETLPVNWYYATNDWCRTWLSKTNSNIRFVCPSSLGTRTCYICLNYTKTTD